jgi:RibD C-terminal domain
LDVPGLCCQQLDPQAWAYEGSPFTVVTDGLERALEQARAVAGDKDVGVGAASIVQQCIRAGLLDELHLDLVPVLLGGGVSLFDHLGTGPIDLERTRVIEGAGVTHLTLPRREVKYEYADLVATVRFKLRRSVVSLPGGRRPEATDRAGLEGLENFPNALVSSRTRATTAVDRGRWPCRCWVGGVLDWRRACVAGVSG